ncbi:MAG: 16S rRNA (cytosine(1402)-N(4))-methyltransferase RsmH [Candidatus Methylacidiphilales bacterium]
MHRPVLLNEVLTILEPRAGKRFLDGTFGRGGHTAALLQAGARVIALDQDPAAVEAARCFAPQLESGQLSIEQMNFRELGTVAEREGGFDGILLDLGVSSPQLDQPERGFSFQADGPLDMRMNPSRPETAADLVNRLDAQALARILFEFGGEGKARPIARAIVEARRKGPITSTLQLAAIVERAVGGRRGNRLHPATRTFQALRIAVNDELGALDQALSDLPSALRSGGRLAVISFHELEDRRVKRFIDHHSQPELRSPGMAFGQPNPDFCLKKLRRVDPSPEEIAANPRARSARLRGAIKL